MVNKMAKTKTRDDAENYWVRREAKAREKSQSDDSDKSDVVKRIFEYMFHNVTEQINAWYSKYASKEGISMSEAKKRADKLDIKAYEEKAKKYVKEKNFSQQANDEMKIYNLTMKANRLELLKSEVALELAAGNDEYEKYIEDCLKDKTIDEMERQAGILGKTIKNNGDMIKSIVNASFYNATFSERIWANQDMLRSELEGYMTKAIIQGKSTNSLISDMRKRFDVSYYAADRLLRTEERRIQTDVAKRSYEENGFGQYKYVIMNTKACDECRKLDGNIYDTKDMTPGVNAPPIHPICYCSTVPYIDRKLFDEYLGDPDSGDMTFEEWQKQKVTTPLQAYRSLNKVSSKLGDRKVYITEQAIDKVKQVEFEGLLDSVGLQELHRELLRKSMGDNDSNEVLTIVNVNDYNQKVITFGSERSVMPSKNIEALTMMQKSKYQSVYWLHNHGFTNEFSYNDLGCFYDERIKALTIVTNKGKIAVINKTKKYSVQKFHDIIS